MPSFHTGERALVFVCDPERGGGCHLTVGLAQGKLSIVRDPATGREVLRRDLGGLRLVDGRSGETVTPHHRVQHFDLESWRRAIRRRVKSGR